VSVATEKSTGSRTPAKKGSAKKGSARKGPAKQGSGTEGGTRKRGSAPRAEAARRASGSEVAASAARQLLELTGREAEGVTGLQRTDDGWKVQVEVVEVRRIPDTTDVLALYEVEVDSDGEMEGYRRLRRYGRGVPGEE
jgi:Gas vesicle synthesis protein GvpO